MANKKFLALMAAGVLAATLALAGCGGTQAASTGAASGAASGSSAASADASAASSASSAASGAASDASSAASAASGAASSAASAASSAASAPAQQQDSYIGLEAARDAALAHAGLSVNDVRELEVELDRDSGTVHYDVEFKSGNKEYSYDIDPKTGDVLSYHSEIDD